MGATVRRIAETRRPAWRRSVRGVHPHRVGDHIRRNAPFAMTRRARGSLPPGSRTCRRNTATPALQRFTAFWILSSIVTGMPSGKSPGNQPGACGRSRDGQRLPVLGEEVAVEKIHGGYPGEWPLPIQQRMPSARPARAVLRRASGFDPFPLYPAYPPSPRAYRGQSPAARNRAA